MNVDLLKHFWGPPSAMVDGHPAVDEISTMRLEVDALSPEDAQHFLGPIAERLTGAHGHGDALRLREPEQLSAMELSASIEQVLAADVSEPVADQEAVVREARMRRVLETLFGTCTEIRRQSGVSA